MCPSEAGGSAGEKRAKRRFSAVLTTIIRDEPQWYVPLLGRAENTLRNWTKESHAPPLNDRHALYRKLCVPSDIEDYDETLWNEYISHLRNYPPAKLSERAELFMSFFYADEFLRREAFLPSPCSVIVVTRDAESDAEHGSIQNTVARNLSRGINYIYVIPCDCANKDALLDFVSGIEQREPPKPDKITKSASAGTAIVMLTDCSRDDDRWRLVDYAWFVTREAFLPTKGSIGKLIPDNLHYGYEQLYKGGDSLPHGHSVRLPNSRVWVPVSQRRQFLFIRLLKNWAGDAQWHYSTGNVRPGG